uniref:Uncharacterized protein n=1 Tax=Glossina pallidipes TaxID=7398 RepID=A0A1A9Z6V2_GLOPL
MFEEAKNYILLGIMCMPAVLTSNVTATTLLPIVMLFRTNDEKNFRDNSSNKLTGLEAINSAIMCEADEDNENMI